MPNCCLTLSQVDVVKNEKPNLPRASRLSQASRMKMPNRVRMITPPAPRETHWKPSSAVTLVERWLTRRGAAPAGSVARLTASAAMALLPGERGRAVDLDPADELLALLDDL